MCSRGAGKVFHSPVELISAPCGRRREDEQKSTHLPEKCTQLTLSKLPGCLPSTQAMTMLSSPSCVKAAVFKTLRSCENSCPGYRGRGEEGGCAFQPFLLYTLFLSWRGDTGNCCHAFFASDTFSSRAIQDLFFHKEAIDFLLTLTHAPTRSLTLVTPAA